MRFVNQALYFSTWTFDNEILLVNELHPGSEYE